MDEPEAVRWIVRFERPDDAALASLDRAGCFAALRAHASATNCRTVCSITVAICPALLWGKAPQMLRGRSSRSRAGGCTPEK